MTVFISWSGKNSVSHKVASALRDWLPNVIQTVQPWLSNADIDAGAQWANEMFQAIKDTKVGIICVTRNNQSEPWISFEAGALAKAMESSRVCPLLIDLKPSDVTGPLTTLQMEQLDEEGLFRVLKMLNQHGGGQLLPEETLRKSFEKWWPDLERDIAIITSTQEPSKPLRNQQEILEEILNTVRSLAKVVPGEYNPVYHIDQPRQADVVREDIRNLQLFLTKYPALYEALFVLTSKIQYENEILVFTFPLEQKNRFETISKLPYVKTLRDAAFAANCKIKLVCDGEEVLVDFF
jgi:hypothetical protein